MPYISINNFKYGLDTRRSQLSSIPGTLMTLQDAHINQGGSPEKRKAFVRTVLPPNTFDGICIGNQIMVFGSLDQSSITFPTPFIYQRLQSPNGGNMTSVISSTSFGGNAFVVATFDDGGTFAFYNGTVVNDFISGVGAVNFDTPNTIAAGLAGLVNLTGVYTAVQNYLGGGLNTFDVFSNPTSVNGAPFVPTITLQTANGTLTDSKITDGSAGTPAAKATGSFQIIAGGDNVHATGTLTSDTTQVSDGDQVVVGTITYRFKNTMAAAFDVKISTTADLSLTNLILAINLTGVVGTNYFTGTTKNTLASAGTLTAHATLVTAINAGTPGNNVLASTTAAHLAWSGLSTGKLSGGTNVNYINQVKVGTETLLTGTVPFNQTTTQTAVDVATAITADSADFTASALVGVVTISTVANTDTYDGDAIEVDAVGNICCGTCTISLTGTGFTLDYINIGTGTQLQNILSSAPVYSTGTLFAFVQTVVANINAFTGTSGYLAFAAANTTAINISKAITISTDPALPVVFSVTPTSGQSGGGGTGSGTPLTVVLSTGIVYVSPVVTQAGHGSPGSYTINTGVITSIVTGGTPPYTYLWKLVTAQNNNNVKVYPVTPGTRAVNYIGTSIGLYGYASTFGGSPITVPAFTLTFNLTVTDSGGLSIVSAPLILSVTAATYS